MSADWAAAARCSTHTTLTATPLHSFQDPTKHQHVTGQRQCHLRINNLLLLSIFSVAPSQKLHDNDNLQEEHRFHDTLLSQTEHLFLTSQVGT
jgi:hypothetical protein